jgi:thiosulfate dehydrogenase [quinone] large subunit
MSQAAVSLNTRLTTKTPTQSVSITGWRYKGIGVVRIAFGLIWAIDASFKWAPDFITGFVATLTGALDGQPAWVQAWIKLWVTIVNIDPHAFAHLVAAAETALAIALILGAFSNLAYIGGTLLALVIWTTAEGFGDIFKGEAMDVGAAIIYVVVFAGLFLSRAGLALGVDRWLTPRLGRWGWIASGPIDSH